MKETKTNFETPLTANEFNFIVTTLKDASLEIAEN